MKIRLILMTGDIEEVTLVPYWKIILDFENYHDSISYKDHLKRMMKEFLENRYKCPDKVRLCHKKCRRKISEEFLKNCNTVVLNIEPSEEILLTHFKRFCKEESLSHNIGIKRIMKSYIYTRLGDGSSKEGSGIPQMWNFMIFK